MKKLGELFWGFVFTAVVLLTTAKISEYTLSTIERLTVKFPTFVELICFIVIWLITLIVFVALIVGICILIANKLEDLRAAKIK